MGPTPAGPATTRPGNAAVPTPCVKNANRRSTIHAPNTPAKPDSRSASIRARCMKGASNGISAGHPAAGEPVDDRGGVGLDRLDVGRALRALGAERVGPQRLADLGAGLGRDRRLDLRVDR